MTDSREVRDGIESTQAALREARAQLEQPMDFEAVRAEVVDELGALEDERQRLVAQIPLLHAETEDARRALISRKTGRAGNLSDSVQTVALVALFIGATGCGLKLGEWLVRQRFDPGFALLAALGVGAIAFSEVTALVRWEREQP